MPESFFMGAVGTLMVDYLVKPIECRVRYFFRFHMIVQELHEQQNNLNREQTRIQEDIKEAKLNIQTQVIEKYVEDWLTDATNALNNVQNLEARIEENKRCFHWCPNWSWRYQLSKSMDEEILAIIKLVNNSKFERIGHCAELPGLELFTSKGLVDSKSSTTAFNKIMKALKDAEINKIGVWGMGGVGKTTLVKEVGNKVKGFGQPIMVVISKIPDIGEIQKKIADGIHLKFEKTTKDGRAKELWCRLKEGKFIIILDDLWNEWNDDEDLRKIGIPLVENGKGCKIILTTRRWTVCKSMECQVTIQIDVLDDDEAWALFKMNANLDENVSRNIIEEAEKIVKECNGLPVAIVTLGRSLEGTKTQKGWELARKKLESSRLMEIGNIEEEEKNAYMCIKMSYEYLKKEVTKRCFLLCALYPEDHSIDVEDLVRYALALELYGKVDSVEEVRVQVLEAIDYLKDSCLLLKDTQWYIKLHDLVRDVALWIASREESGFMIKSRLELLNESFEPCRAISLLNIEEKKLLGRLIPSNLEILLLKNCDVQGTCFQWMKELKALSLTADKHCPVGMISLYALSSLPKLRALRLENFEDFSFLRSLRTVEVLSLRGLGFEGLSNELWRLENLKILDLTDCTFRSRFPPNVIQRLSKLEQLYLKGSNICETIVDILVQINFLSRLTALSLRLSLDHFMGDVVFPKLERYDISVVDPYKLKCDLFSITEKSWKIKGPILLNVVSLLPENLESFEVLDDIDKFLECLIDKSLRLSNLKLLYLHNLSNLSCIGELPTQHVRLEGLVDLRITNCPSLKSLFPLSLAQSLVLLEILEIANCPRLKQIVTEMEGDEEKISSSINSHNSLGFPNLRELYIGNCYGLVYIFPTLMAPQGLPLLENLAIHRCPQLKQVVRPREGRVENDVVLQQLQFSKPLMQFSVSACPLLTDSFVHLDVEKACFKEVRLSTFKESFSSAKHLEVHYAIEDHNLVPDAKGDGLNGLMSLQLRDCKDLECLVDITMGNGPTFAFTNLKRLSIEDMFGFETLCKGHHPPQGFLQSLKVVNIKGCRKLEILFSPSITQSLVFLEELTIEFCRELRTLFSVLENDGGIRSNSCFPPFCLPKLKTLYIRLCSKLEYVLPITLAQGLPALASISVFGCDELKHVFSMPKEQDGVELHGIMLLPSLQYLRLSGLENLTSFVPENFFIKAPALKSLEAYECPKVMNFHIQQVNKQLTLKGNGLYVFKELSCNTNLIPDVHSRHLDGLTSLDIYHWWGGECLVDKSQAKMGILQNLKDLRVSYSSMSEVFRIDEGLYNREENQAPQLLLNLEQLQLKRLPYLRWIVQGPIHCVNLQSLKVLEITHCNKLTSIFSISVVQTLRSLEELKIYDCDKLKSVLMELEIDTEPNKLCLPNLKTVEIVKCPSLEYVFPLALTQGFPRLQKVQLVKLRNMRGFVAGNNFVQAPALEILIIKELCSAFTNFVFQKEVNKCDPLKELTFCTKSIDDEDVEPCNMVNTQLRQRSTNFEYMTLGNFEQLFRLQGACFISNLEKMQLSNMIWLRDIWKGPIHFESNLRELAVYDSNCLTYIFPATFIPHFPHLSILKIKACENLKQIIANDDISTSSSQGPQLEKKMVFPHIKQIILENLPRLERFGLAGYHMEFPCLDLLDVKQCFKMITSFTVDYLTLTVHAKSNEASQLDDFNPSPEVIFWEKRRPTLLPQYVEEAEKVSPLK
ncbi:hypothetical protein ERO13_A06G069400v2 [Gossypium hirsutum]|uniref:NB-ARC domain-containing protein n=1 Tax=Gossypium hirsutum TaxID=3635 RepID=A0ABM3BVV4_GOSHI|nr:uncharacterized protein LOC107962698 [Gossypium hirsutum]KAG4194729.1 hypothetical protein ERO13_A06G069400v2 [Gossypium hirsutum]